ncbi:MAG: hypothetical protein GX757_03815 [Clostridiales bacterium]|nr:hypothetical protein [Clostridiales bacterium]
MDQYNYIPNDNMQAELPEDTTKSAKIISRSFLAVFVLTSVALITKYAINWIVTAIKPEIVEENWYVALMAILSFDGVGRCKNKLGIYALKMKCWSIFHTPTFIHFRFIALFIIVINSILSYIVFQSFLHNTCFILHKELIYNPSLI